MGCVSGARVVDGPHNRSRRPQLLG